MALAILKRLGSLFSRGHDNQPRNWHPEDIKAAVRKRGVTLTKLATDAGLSESACRVALVRPSPAGEQAIAAFLRVPAAEIWPDRYSEPRRRGRPSRGR